LRELETFDSIYQWLPAEYKIGSTGEVTIASYINNLGRKEHPELYRDIASVFRLFVPMFEQLLHQSLMNRSLQVITKAANYVLKPGQEYEGSWHVEGVKQEHIIASGIYYYSTSPNIKGSSLAFREQREDSLSQRESTHNASFARNLGRVRTLMGRSLVFTNELQHKVKRVENDENSTEIAMRKILCFFLVDPNVRIKSSANIPEQQWDKYKPMVASSINEVTQSLIRTKLPTEVVARILEFAKWGLTLDEAKQHRLELIKERKYYVDKNNKLWERNFSFCEH